MWIHEGWTTYLENAVRRAHVRVRRRAEVHERLQVEGAATASRSSRSAASTASPPQDMYFKGALFLNTLRSVVNDDARWWKLLRDFFQHFKYQNIMTEDVVAVLQRAARAEPDADLRSVPAAHGAPDARAQVRRDASGRSRTAGRPTSADFAMPMRVGDEGQVADHPADDRVADDEDAAQEGRVRGRDGPLLRQRDETVGAECRFRPSRATNGHKELS